MTVLSSEDSVGVLQSAGQEMSPPALARGKSLSMTSIVVDMGLKSVGAVEEVVYSPNKKAMRPEPVSRIHLIPLLMVLVFFVLWASSSEVGSRGDSIPQIFVSRMPILKKSAISEQLKASKERISQHGNWTEEDSEHASHALSTDGLSTKLYLRGRTR